VMFLDGAVRLFPAWEISLLGFTISPLFWPAVLLPGALTMLPLMYPFLEARFTKDKQAHHLLQRPRDVPGRTALGAMAIAFYLVLTLSGANDVIAERFNISLNAMTWAGRLGLLLAPPLAYYITYRTCLALQQHDREVLAHGAETGIIKRLPDGGFVEIHQPLAAADDHGHVQLDYAGAPVPKKMNRLGALLPTVRGFFYPIEKPAPPARLDQPTEAPVSPAPAREEITTGH
jgi:ubiquinol-cytochrome c reductase cytochrome b subunit